MKNPLNDKILLLKIKNQDPDAYGQFYDAYVSRIYRFIFFKVSSVSDAQDLTSEVFLKLWQYVREGREVKNLNAFAYMVARNAVIDFYRQRQRQSDNELAIDESSVSQLVDEHANLLAQHAHRSDMDQLIGGLKHLKEEYREVLVLRFLDDLSISEIATILNKSNGSVRVLIHRALQALRDSVRT